MDPGELLYAACLDGVQCTSRVKQWLVLLKAEVLGRVQE